MRTASNVALVVILVAGVCLLAYPSVSEWWNSMHQTRAINGYIESVAALDDEAYEALLAEARTYNGSLVGKAGRFTMSDSELEEYESLLSVAGTDVIGYLEIDKIDVELPIYHGTSSAVLQIGAGHLEGSSLPVGGESTHSVISAHRGLPSARLLTDLDELEEGDTFVIHVLNETFTYEVDQIRVVEPTDFSELAIVEGEDYCTLMTCTPYGINTHRLLVRGHRVDNADDSRVTADATQVDPLLVAPIVATPLLALTVAGVVVRSRRGRPRKVAFTGHEGGERDENA